MRRYLRTLGYIAGFIGVLLAIVALVRVSSTNQRLTDVREELLMVAQGIRQNDIRSLSTRMENLSTDLSKVSGDLRTLTTDVQGMRTKVDQLGKDLAGLSAKVTAMDSARLEDLTARLNALAKELEGLAGRLARVEETAARVAALSADLSRLSQEFAGLRAQVSALDSGRIEAVAQRVGSVAGELEGLAGRLAALEAEQAKALAELAGLGVRIGVVDAEALFVQVFLPQVGAERAALQAKAQALQELQARRAQGQIPSPAYEQEYARRQAEALQAQARVNTAMLERLLASPGFAAFHADLQKVRDQALTWAEEADALVRQAQVAVLDYTAFFNQIQQLQAAFQQVDQLLTQVAAMKILEISQQVAQEEGYHLVLRVKDVVMYRVEPVVDLTKEVEKRLWALFGS